MWSFVYRGDRSVEYRDKDGYPMEKGNQPYPLSVGNLEKMVKIQKTFMFRPIVETKKSRSRWYNLYKQNNRGWKRVIADGPLFYIKPMTNQEAEKEAEYWFSNKVCGIMSEITHINNVSFEDDDETNDEDKEKDKEKTNVAPQPTPKTEIQILEDKLTAQMEEIETNDDANDGSQELQGCCLR
jgi:hypothetical protein